MKELFFWVWLMSIKTWYEWDAKSMKAVWWTNSKKKLENDLQLILKTHITLITITKDIYSVQKEQTLYV